MENTTYKFSMIKLGRSRIKIVTKKLGCNRWILKIDGDPGEPKHRPYIGYEKEILSTAAAVAHHAAIVWRVTNERPLL